MGQYIQTPCKACGGTTDRLFNCYRQKAPMIVIGECISCGDRLSFTFQRAEDKKCVKGCDGPMDIFSGPFLGKQIEVVACPKCKNIQLPGG